MAKAICINCGATKRRGGDSCRECGFDPQKDETTLAKSIYLSSERAVVGNAPPDWEGELAVVQAAIQAGRKPAFDSDEIERIIISNRAAREVSLRAVWLTVLRFFLPALLLIGAIWLCVSILRSL